MTSNSFHLIFLFVILNNAMDYKYVLVCIAESLFWAYTPIFGVARLWDIQFNTQNSVDLFAKIVLPIYIFLSYFSAFSMGSNYEGKNDISYVVLFEFPWIYIRLIIFQVFIVLLRKWLKMKNARD